MKKIVYTKNAPEPIGPYSQGISSGSYLFTAGQIPVNPTTGELVQGDITLQTRQVLSNIRAILEAAGLSLNSVVKTTVFLKDMNEFAAMNEVYAEFFNDAKPARSTVQVSRLPRDAGVEIEVTALTDR